MDKKIYLQVILKMKTIPGTLIPLRSERVPPTITVVSTISLSTSIKLERIEDILVVHRDQNDTQRKNYASLVKVWDEKVMPLIEGKHGKE